MILRLRLCIPTFNNPGTICDVIVDSLSAVTIPILVVDDGSLEPVRGLISRHAQSTILLDAISDGRLEILRLPENRGKGLALQAAFRDSVEKGYTHLLAIDGDGQHYPRECEKLISLAKDYPWDLIVGARKFQGDTVPGASKFGRRFSNFWVGYQTGVTISDSQSGFRLYPLFQLQNLKFFTRRYDFEIEVLIRAIWRGVNLREVEIDVFYPKREERVSHFNKLWDNVRISLLNIVFVVLSLLKDRKSPGQLAISLGVGVFIGSTPFFGLHTFLVALVAFAFRLNVSAAFIGSQVSLPFIAPFLIAGSIAVGKTFVPSPWGPFAIYLLGSFVLGGVLALVSGLTFYVGAKLRNQPKKAANWNGRSRGGVVGNAILHFILKNLGTGAGYFVLRFIVPYFYLFAPRGRKALNEYYSIIRPEMGWLPRQLTIVAHFYRFGQILMDQTVQRHSKIPQYSTVPHGIEHIMDCLRSGQGLILLSAHVGSWSLAADLLPTKGAIQQLTVVEYKPNEMQMRSPADSVRTAGEKPEGLSHDRLAPNLAEQPIFNIQQLLTSGKPVGLMGDRPLGSRFELVLFYGKLAPVDVTAFRIAAALKKPLVMTYGFKKDARVYNFYAGPAKIYAYEVGVDRELQLKTWAQDYAHDLEKILKLYPEQWFNFFPFWSSVPSVPPGVRTGKAPNYLKEELEARSK
ncbi:MAG: DUF2062 domain-containing protein [Proteobacteria bacterium]|nr:MAG: DUF2062 domain-containing protein [Pseudomonadota bacterium]